MRSEKIIEAPRMLADKTACATKLSIISRVRTGTNPIIRARAQKGKAAITVFEKRDKESDRLFVLPLKRDPRPVQAPGQRSLESHGSSGLKKDWEQCQALTAPLARYV